MTSRTSQKRLFVAGLLSLLVLLAACLSSEGDNPALVGTPPTSTTIAADSTTTTSVAVSAPAKVAAFIPGLSAENAGILDACLAGDDASCDKAQEAGRLNDSNFSRLNEACTANTDGACTLKDRLVAAELRLHCKEGDQSACDAV